jgi:C1A family cysteine protease
MKTTRQSSLVNPHSFGWIPDLPDQRDYQYCAIRQKPVKSPASTDLTSKCPPVYDQGELGSCTANAWCALYWFIELLQKLPGYDPSRLAFYYDERVKEGSVNQDSGAQLRTGAKVAAQIGCGHDSLDPYVVKNFRKKPTSAYYTDAKKHQALAYYRVNQTLDEMRACLAAGFPFVLGFSVYESFETDAVAKTGVVPMPKPTESLLGGHAVLAVGYDDKSKRFIVRNSWGTAWGMKGYFTMPYDYLVDDDLSADFWTIRLVE